MQTSAEHPLFFCHGVPGGPDDAALLEAGDRLVIAPNLFDFATGDPVQNLLTVFDTACAEEGSDGMHVVGFSIGAMAALRLAAARPQMVAKVTVISPAAPLQLGSFLPEMAGAPVFKLAMRHLTALRMLTAVQGLLARKAPGILINQLFAKCGVQEQALMSDPQFLAALRAAMRNSFAEHRAGYLKYLSAYVADWTEDLARVQAPVEIWHGDADTWAPMAMSEAIREMIPSSCALNIVAGGEHYSTLKAAQIV